MANTAATAADTGWAATAVGTTTTTWAWAAATEWVASASSHPDPHSATLRFSSILLIPFARPPLLRDRACFPGRLPLRRLVRRIRRRLLWRRLWWRLLRRRLVRLRRPRRLWPHGRRVRPWRVRPHDRAHGPRGPLRRVARGLWRLVRRLVRRQRWPRRVRLLSRPVRGARPLRARRPTWASEAGHGRESGVGRRAQRGVPTRDREAGQRPGAVRGGSSLLPHPHFSWFSCFWIGSLALRTMPSAPPPTHTLSNPSCLCRPSPLSSSSSPVLSPSPPSSTYCQNMSS
mmetsp:Transcript_23032/g.65942  ORF Transcript_23032/g.65942 Transcript_23032/m.65942 type:complete len:287 (-) Transcript_23032:28-888(-)